MRWPPKFDSLKRRLRSQKGIAALTAVIMVIVILAAVGTNYLAQMGQKQTESALIYSSTAAETIAEAGIRYAEKCLKNNLSGCPCYASGTCTTWGAMGGVSGSPPAWPAQTFGNGTFTVSFCDATAGCPTANTNSSKIKTVSVGSFGGASRQISKILLATCPLSQDAVTACTINTTNNGVITGTQSSGNCSLTALTPFTLPVTAPPASTCPNSNWPTFTGGMTPAAPYQYCSWSEANSDAVTITGPATIYVAGNFSIQNSASLTVNGNVTINVAGNVSIQNNSTITIPASTNSSAGTSLATFTSGSSTVTVSTGSWPAIPTGARITADGGSNWYTIQQRVSNTTLTLSSNFTGATATYNWTIASGSLTFNVIGTASPAFSLQDNALFNCPGGTTGTYTNIISGTSLGTFTNGSPTVTLASGSWPASAVWGRITADVGANWYPIQTRVSNTSLTLASNFTGASNTYNWIIGGVATANALINIESSLSVALGNNICYAGAINAPQSTVPLTNNTNTAGSIIANTINVSNNANLSYTPAGTATNGYSAVCSSGTGSSSYGGG